MKKILKFILIRVLGEGRFNKFKNLFSLRPDELTIIAKFFSIIKLKGLMIDVGVHYGESSSVFLENGWKVIGFEPDEANRKRISSYVTKHPKFQLFDCAISAEEGEMMFYRSNESSGISSLLKFHATHEADSVVPVRTLNNVLAENGINQINFLKIDTEGHDFQVLKGIDLSRYHELRVIICEFEDKKTSRLGYTVLDMIGYLQENGFEVIVSEWYPIVKYGANHKFKAAKKFPCEISDHAWGNLIAYKIPEFENYFLVKMNARVLR